MTFQNCLLPPASGLKNYIKDMDWFD